MGSVGLSSERHGDSIEAIRQYIFKEDGAAEGRENKERRVWLFEEGVVEDDSISGMEHI